MMLPAAFKTFSSVAKKIDLDEMPIMVSVKVVVVFFKL